MEEDETQRNKRLFAHFLSPVCPLVDPKHDKKHLNLFISIYYSTCDLCFPCDTINFVQLLQKKTTEDTEGHRGAQRKITTLCTSVSSVVSPILTRICRLLQMSAESVISQKYFYGLHFSALVV